MMGRRILMQRRQRQSSLAIEKKENSFNIEPKIEPQLNLP